MLQWITHNRIFGILLLAILFIGIAIRMFFLQTINCSAATDFSFIPPIIGSNPIWNILAYLAFTAAGIALLIRMCNTYKLLENSSLISAAFCLIGILIFPDLGIYYSLSIGSILVLLALHLILQIHHQPSVMTQLFAAATLIGFGVLFYYPLLLFVLLLALAMSLFRPFSIRNIFMILLGVSLPIFYFLALSYLFDYPMENLNFQWPKWEAPVLNNNRIPFLLFCIVPLLGIIKIYLNRSRLVVRQRNQVLILVIFLFLYSGMSLWMSLEFLLPILLANAALYAAYYYQQANRKWIIDAFLIVLIIVSFLS